MTKRIAYFISPHGFGHAARAAAVMEALLALNSDIQFELFTLVPPWFFEHSAAGHFHYHQTMSDIGLVQENALTEDAPETVRRLDEFLPFSAEKINPLAEEVKRLDCQMLICDISPLGIAVAQAADISSLLIENFTWDWIYQGYLSQAPELGKHIATLKEIFAAADYHIQSDPLCSPADVDLTVPPISRKIRTPAAEIRRMLGLSAEAKVVMVTMGGMSWDYTFLRHLQEANAYHFIIPGAAKQTERQGNVLLLPNHSTFFHPDLINASDALVGKVGYSTLAEVHQAGIPYGYVTRRYFQEASILADYIDANMTGLPIDPARFADGSWIDSLPELLSFPPRRNSLPNGADAAAAFSLEAISNDQLAISK